MTSTPEEFLAHLGGGGLRRFLEDVALRPLNKESQEAAGLAAAAAAAGLEEEEFTDGLETVNGAYEAAGTKRLTPPDPSIPQEPGAAAFFDVDNTLIQGASIVIFAAGLYKRKYFTVRQIIPIAWKQLKFRVTGNENADDVAEGRAQALEFIKGRTVEELQALCEEIFDETMNERIWPGTQALAEDHLAAGHEVWLVSATPVQLAQVLARRLGFTGALGTVAEVKDGRFTGRLVGDILHGPGKKHAVAALAAMENLDLSRCYAYSDSINDLPLLTMVGNCVAINPDRRLRTFARNNGWPIKDFRSVRKAIHTYGLPTLATASVSLLGWRYIFRR